LDELTGGFGGFMIQATEWGTREQVMKSYELIARYVMPHFQNSLQNLQSSYNWAVDNSKEIMARRQGAIKKATSEYENKKT
jgi:limonene 1,2-monooxygenase